MPRMLSSDREVLEHVTAGRPIVDVRAPIEFEQGSVPGSHSIPLLNNDERARVGTCYRNEGEAAAIALGHQLISGATKAARVQAWCEFFLANPKSAIMCFRGGQRSRLVQAEAERHGYQQPLIRGGFKRMRQLLSRERDRLATTTPFYVLSGLTGSGKTKTLRAQSRFLLDLEAIAEHRGSSFGQISEKQPPPATFENRLAVSLLKLEAQRTNDEFKQAPVWIEDESRSIGRLVLPLPLFQALSKAPIFILDRAREERAQHLIEEYLCENHGFCDGMAPPKNDADLAKQKSLQALHRIGRKLGGLETHAVTTMIDDAFAEFLRSGNFAVHRPWVMRLLERYYDPMYEHHLARSLIAGERRILGRGDLAAFEAFTSSAPQPDIPRPTARSSSNPEA